MQKRFVSESELEDIRKKREEEWKKAREQGRELPRPSSPVDSRSLYEQLQEQKEAKKEEIEEQLKFKNMIYKGLDSEESDFLSFVADKQAEIDGKRFDQDSAELREYRNEVHNLSTKATGETTIAEPTQKKKQHMLTVQATAKSQQALMFGIVRSKRTLSDSKQDRENNVKKAKVSDEKNTTDKTSQNTKTLENNTEILPSTTNVLNSSLANLGNYSSSDSE